MNSNINGGTVSLFSLNSFDVNDKLFTVALNNFSYLLTLVMASQYLYFIVFTDRHGSTNIRLEVQVFKKHHVVLVRIDKYM